MGRDRGWAGLRAPCQQRGAEQSQLRGAGAGGVWRAGSYVSASARSKPVRPARPQRRRFPNCCRHKHLPCSSPRMGTQPAELWESGAGRSGRREQQHPGFLLLSWLPAHPSPPSCPLSSHSLSHSSPAQPSTEKGMHSRAQPQESLAGVTQESRIPISKGNEMLFSSSFSRGLFISLLME